MLIKLNHHYVARRLSAERNIVIAGEIISAMLELLAGEIGPSCVISVINNPAIT
jgi:hypothetical protein